MTPITVLNKGNVPMGPFTREQVAEKLQSGEVTPASLAHVEGLAQWTPLCDVLALVDAASLPAMPFTPATVPQASAPAYSYAVTMQPPAHLVYANFWPRVAAHILDNLVVSVPFVFIWVMLFSALIGFNVFSQFARPGSSGPEAPSVALVGIVILAYVTLIFGRIIFVWLYHAFLESGPHQSTWGKRALGLKVTGITGQRITFGHASGRYFSTMITNMTMGIGYLMVAFTERKQALHDMIAGTLVVRK